MCIQDERSLIAQLGEGGEVAEKAFRTLDKMYRSTMHAILSKQFSIYDASIREDIIQETFISIFNKHNSFRGDSSLKNWILSILKNKAINYTRKEKTARNISTALSDVQNTAFNDPPELTDFECEKQALEAFRKKYPAQFSQIMQIAWNGLTLKQLASLENINHGAARERISSYRKKLKAFIEHFCGNQQ